MLLLWLGHAAAVLAFWQKWVGLVRAMCWVFPLFCYFIYLLVCLFLFQESQCFQDLYSSAYFVWNSPPREWLTDEQMDSMIAYAWFPKETRRETETSWMHGGRSVVSRHSLHWKPTHAGAAGHALAYNSFFYLSMKAVCFSHCRIWLWWLQR